MVRYFFLAAIFIFLLSTCQIGDKDRFKKEQTISVDNAAKILSNRILEASSMNAEAVKKFYEEHNDEELEIDAWKLWEIIFEFEFLFLHVTDRMSFDIHDQDRRSVFMDRLIEVTVNSTINTAFPRLGLDESGNLKSSMLKDYNANQYEYGQYRKMFPGKNESSKDTVFWEFGKNVAKRIGEPTDISYIMLSMELAVASLKYLDLNNILQSIH